MRQTVLATTDGFSNHVAVMGSLSMIFWALVLVVTVKYVTIIMRADNNGEGGTLALAALAHRSPGLSRRLKSTIGVGAILGLALFYGDGMLTPAITVLSAVEGLEVESKAFAPLVVPLTLIILIGLFAVPEPRHRQDRTAVRAGDAALVRDLGGIGRVFDRPESGHPGRGQSALCRRPVRACALDRLRFAGRGGSGGDRLRSALCRYGPFRQKAHSICLVLRGAARAAAGLFRPGRGAAARSQSGGRRLLLHRAALGAFRHGDAGDDGRRSSPARPSSPASSP